MAVELRGSGTTKGDSDGSPKPSRVEKITKALEGLEADGSIADCITDTPGAFLWEFYKAWVENGGQDGGKNRNSIRRMRDIWLTDENDVKSLHPKLTGRVRVSKEDAASLITLFLTRWRFVGVSKGDWTPTLDGYAPFPCKDPHALTAHLVDVMYPEGSKHAQIGLLLPARPGETERISRYSAWDEFGRLYNDLDAHITLSRHNSTIGPTPSDTIKLFWHYISYLYDEIGTKDTILIWIIDIGGRQVEDDDAWKDFFNFEMMKTQFRAFASFDSETDRDDLEDTPDERSTKERSGIHDAFLRSIAIPEEGHRERRWKWLCERSVIVIQNLRKEEFEHLYTDEDQLVGKFRLRDIGVTAETILPSMIPTRWSQLRELRELYGRDLNDISDATLTVLFNRAKKAAGGSKAVRYFAHTLNSRLQEDTPLASAAISRELTSPGVHYDEAMGLVYWAARHRLKKIRGEQDGANAEEWAIATAYLVNQGFRVIRLPEFMKIHRSPGE